MSSFGGRGRGSARGGGRGGRGGSHGGSAGGGFQSGGARGGGAGRGEQQPIGPKPRFTPCRNFTSSGSCTNQSCHFSHVVQLHGAIAASSPIQQDQTQPQHGSNFNGRSNPQQQQGGQRFYPVSCAAIWENSPNPLKIFSGSYDGYWRLWNPSANFSKEFEHTMSPSSKIHQMAIFNNHLFVAFEGVCVKVPGVAVGMIHAWNLASPQDPPIEFHMSDNAVATATGGSAATPIAQTPSLESELTPYAHAMGVSALLVHSDPMASGSIDGTIRLWTFDQTSKRFHVTKTLHGHAREVTSLARISNNNILWSSSTDRTVRLWDVSTGKCQYLITGETKDAGGNAIGHTDAVTALLPWEGGEQHGGSYVLSSSMDGTVKVWSGGDARMVASETHGQGVVSIALGTEGKGKPILFCGLESGNVMIRSLIQTSTTPAFCLLLTLNARYINCGHEWGNPVRCIVAGPASTFYTGGDDGKLNVWQVTGDLGLG